jgi:hypothetical protein
MACNLLLGCAKDSIEILASAIRYLQKHADGSSTKTESVGMAQDNSLVSFTKAFGTGKA